MNVLLTSVGRRSYLVRYFQEALSGQGKVLVANCIQQAAAMHVADQAFLVPPSHDQDYGRVIMDICTKHDVKLLCSCHDLDLLALAALKDELERIGVRAILPTYDWALTCLDKIACNKRFREAGFSVPWSVPSLQDAVKGLVAETVRFPLVVKARYGFGSQGLSICNDMEELEHACNMLKKQPHTDSLLAKFLDMDLTSNVLIQQYIPDREIRLALLNDLDGNPAAHFIAEIHAMRAGESDWATTMDRSVLSDLPQRIANLTRHIGIWGIDIMMKNNEPLIIDVNPRFTGDYPFHHIAGANVPSILLAWASGKEPNNDWLYSKAGVTGFKDLVPMIARSMT